MQLTVLPESCMDNIRFVLALQGMLLPSTIHTQCNTARMTGMVPGVKEATCFEAMNTCTQTNASGSSTAVTQHTQHSILLEGESFHRLTSGWCWLGQSNSL